MNEHICPVCGYDKLEFPPRNFSICACCGTEFGYDDRVLSHERLRARWIRKGFPWFDPDEQKPIRWNPIDQLLRAGYASDLLAIFDFEDSAAEVASRDVQILVPVVRSGIVYTVAA
jgi:hypothetical protein